MFVVRIDLMFNIIIMFLKRNLTEVGTLIGHKHTDASIYIKALL